MEGEGDAHTEPTPGPHVFDLHSRWLGTEEICQNIRSMSADQREKVTDAWLWQNLMYEWPHDLELFPNLQRLSLWNNKITELPETISKLTNLEVLNINGLQLARLPDGLGNLTRLEYLYLGMTGLRNPMRVLPDVVSRITSLKELSLARVGLEEVPVSLLKLPNLHTLLLRGNPGLPADVQVDIHKNPLKIQRLLASSAERHSKRIRIKYENGDE